MMNDASAGKPAVLSLKNVVRQYTSGDRTLEVLRGIDLELRAAR